MNGFWVVRLAAKCGMKSRLYRHSWQWLFLASKSSATIQLTVLPVEARTQRPGYKDKSRAGDKSSKDKYKDKWGSSKQNRVGAEENLVEKPSKSGKWNSYREDEAYYYWDSINNHVQRGAKDKSKSSLKVTARKSIMCCVLYFIMMIFK